MLTESIFDKVRRMKAYDSQTALMSLQPDGLAWTVAT